jgi:periplasmic protein TonB
VLTELGTRSLAERTQRSVVLAAIVSLHALVIYFLVNGAPGTYGRSDTPVIEAEVIPADRRIPSPPPSFPEVTLQESNPVAIPLLQITIELPAEQPPASQAIDASFLASSQLPVAANAPTVVDPDPIVRPRPIGGPRGVDRYPNASIRAKESGTVEMNICVSPTGRVDSVELARSSGFPRLDQVALTMASEYQFQPATRQGHPIAACVHYRIIFKVV